MVVSFIKILSIMAAAVSSLAVIPVCFQKFLLHINKSNKLLHALQNPWMKSAPRYKSQLAQCIRNQSMKQRPCDKSPDTLNSLGLRVLSTHPWAPVSNLVGLHKTTRKCTTILLKLIFDQSNSWLNKKENSLGLGKTVEEADLATGCCS